MKKITLLSLIIFIILIPELSSGKENKDSNILDVGFIPDSPPFQYIDDNENKGFNIDIMNHIAKEQSFKVIYHPMTQKETIEAIKNGEIDILLGVPFTKKNDEIMSFTEPYVTSAISVITPKGHEIKSLTDINSGQVAVQLNTLEYEFLRNIRDIDLHVSQRQDTSLKILTKERADIFVGNDLTTKYLLKKENIENEYEFIENRLLPLDYSFAVQKENYTLVNQLNKGINSLKLSNEYSIIYNKWFDKLDTPLSKKLRIFSKFMIVLLIIGIIIFLFGLRWNRQLKKEVNRKTKDLQYINESLELQVKKTKESDQTKEQVLESSLRGIITVDKDGVILTINSVACDLFDVDHTVIGNKFREEIFIWNQLQEKILRVLETKEKYLNQELNISEYTKEIEYIKYDIQPIYNVYQEVTGVLLFFLDVTQEKKLQEHLFEEEKSRVLIQLVAGLVHEIRNPLTSIKAFVEMIPSKMGNQDFRKEIVTHVPKEIDRLNELLESLINYAKPVSQHTKVIDLSSLLKSVALLFTSNIENKGYSLLLDIKKELYIKGDEDQIKQVLINIILNAIESMNNKKYDYDDRPVISLKLSTKKNQNTIEIKDNGIGMSKETLHHIFDPFYTTKTAGTGLGLGISKQFIKENKGEIYLESELDKGTKFTLNFIKWRSSNE